MFNELMILIVVMNIKTLIVSSKYWIIDFVTYYNFIDNKINVF